MQGIMHLSWSSGFLSQRTCTPGVPLSSQASSFLRLALPATWQASSLVTPHPALKQPVQPAVPQHCHQPSSWQLLFVRVSSSHLHCVYMIVRPETAGVEQLTLQYANMDQFQRICCAAGYATGATAHLLAFWHCIAVFVLFMIAVAAAAGSQQLFPRMRAWCQEWFTAWPMQASEEDVQLVRRQRLERLDPQPGSPESVV